MEKARLTKSEVMSYALYSFFSGLAVMVPMTYCTTFMTENLLMSAALMGTVILSARIIDFVISLIAGGIVEKSKMKWGKYSSWMIVLRWVVIIGIMLEFFDTTALPMAARAVIAILAYVMINGCMNFVATAQYGILAVMAGPSMEDRNILSFRGMQFMAAATIITSIGAVPVITWLTPIIGQSMGYFVVATVFAIPFIYGVHKLTKSAKPYDPVQTKESAACLPTVTVGDMIKSVVTNGQLLVVILSYTMFYSGMFAFNTVMAYYFIYVLGNFLLMSVALTAVTVFALFASIIGPKIGVRIGKKRAMVFGQLIYAIGALCIALFGQISLVLYIAINCVMSVGMYMFSSFSVIYMLDAGEYGFYKTGKDNRTVGMSMMNIPMKIGMAVGGAVGGFGLAYIGFSTGMTVTASFIDNFMWLLGGIPAAFYLLGSIVMAIGYRITDADAALYAKENAERVAKLMENC